MKKVILLLVFMASVTLPTSVKAQEVLDGLYVKEHVTNNRPIPFPYIREADVMWAKKYGALLICASA
jgi:hypothetical protein